MTDRASAAPMVLSVVLPNYNHGRYLSGALDALLSQDRPADEIVVVDDCSTDDSREIVARYAARYPSVRLVANAKNIGVIAALTLGLNNARGEYVYFGAADDFVMPGFFGRALELLRANPGAGFCCGEVNLVDGQSGRVLGVRPPVRPRFSAGFIGPSKTARLLRRNDNFIATGAAVFRRGAAIWAGGFDEQLWSFADGYLVRKIAMTFGFCYVPRAVLTWRIFPDSVSRTMSTQSDRAKLVLDKAEARMAADPAFPRWYPAAFASRWRFATCRLAVQASPVNRDLLMDMGAQNAIDSALLGYCLKAFSARSARFLILAWLWFRLRPFSIIGLVSTALARNLDRFRVK